MVVELTCRLDESFNQKDLIIRQAPRNSDK